MNARAIFFRPITLAGLLAAGALAAFACGGPGASSPNGNNGGGGASSANPNATAGSGVAGDAGATATTASNGPWECTSPAGYERCLEHDRLREDVLDDLEDLEASRDQRNVPIALDAVASKDPLVVAAGMRILGQFPREAGVTAAAWPYLFSSHPIMQHLAAEIVSRGEDDAKAHVAKQWKKGHSGSVSDLTPYDRDPQRDPKTWGWTAYEGAAHYPPGDSPTTLGYSTTASPDAVVAFYANAPGARTLTPDEFRAMVMAPINSASDQINALMAEYQRTHDQSILQKIKTVTESISKGGGMAAMNMPLPEGAVTAKFVIAESRATKAARIAVVYAEPAIGKTVLMLSWDPSIYTAPMTFAKPKLKRP